METIYETDKQAMVRSSENSPPADFSWYELHTPDAEAAAAFYGPVLGWNITDANVPGRKYSMVHAGEIPIGGFLEKPAKEFESGTGAQWVGYIGVNEVDLFSQRVQEAGGTIYRAAEDIPDVGRFAVAGDPQGGMFVLFQPLPGMTAPEQPTGCSTPGMPAWRELGAIEWEAEFAFYSGLFGWTKAQAIDMGPGAVYQLFSAGADPIGGMMTIPIPTQRAGWMYYFNVEDINAGIERVKQNGGSVVSGPYVVPGGAQVAQCRDTQGGAFGIVGPGPR